MGSYDKTLEILYTLKPWKRSTPQSLWNVIEILVYPSTEGMRLNQVKDILIAQYKSEVGIRQAALKCSGIGPRKTGVLMAWYDNPVKEYDNGQGKSLP